MPTCYASGRTLRALALACQVPREVHPTGLQEAPPQDAGASLRDTPPTITVPPQPVTTEFTRRLAQAQAMVLVTQCQRVEKALIDGPGAAVSVRVVRATGLLAADKGGTSDPFVTVLSKGSKKAKTSVKKKTLEPEWDETLDLTVHDLAAPLSLTVFDHDKGAKNDNLGSAEITGLSEIEPGVPTPYKVALSKQGAVEVVVTLEYRVSVHVVRAKDLLAADKNGKSDPYVVVQSAGGKKAKTSVKKKTLEPEGDETLDLTVPDLAAPLSLTVMDYDKVCTPNPHPEPSPGPNFAPVRNSARDPNPYPDPNPTLDHDTIGITD